MVDEDISLPIKDFSLSERLALLMAVRQLASSSESFLSYQGLEAARKLISSLDEKWRQATRMLFDEFVLKEGFGCSPDILNALQNACLENRRIVIEYKKPDQSAFQKYEFDPYLVYFPNRSMYVDGFCSTRSDYRTFKIARIKSVSKTTITFSRRKDFDFKTQHKGTFTAFTGNLQTKVIIRFYPAIRTYIEETLWHHTQQIIPLKDGSIEFRVTVAEPREVMWWAFQWGEHAEILEPRWLRQEAKDTVKKMSILYEQDPKSTQG